MAVAVAVAVAQEPQVEMLGLLVQDLRGALAVLVL
jgi:hypothetical protein